jgi:hypothetical protein
MLSCFSHFNPAQLKHNSKKCKKTVSIFYITFTLKLDGSDIMFEKGICGKLNRLSNNSGKSDKSLPLGRGRASGGGDKIDMESGSYLFTLPLIPSRRGRGN